MIFLARPWEVAAGPVSLTIKIIYAHSRSKTVDPKLKELAKTKAFSQLKFTAYELKDEATLRLEPGATGSIELPNKQWMKVRAAQMLSDGKVRIDFKVDKPSFSTTALIAPGATLAVGGPAYESGALILAVTRPKK